MKSPNKHFLATSEVIGTLRGSGDGVCLLASHLPCVQLTKNRPAKRQLVSHGEAIAETFDQRGKFFKLAGTVDIPCIDSLLVTPLVFYAANETLEQDLGRRATQHARTVRDTLITEDGSFTRAAEELTAGVSHSPSPLELAKALHGFVHCYLLSNQAEFLNVAQRCGRNWVGQAWTTDQLPMDALGVAAVAFRHLVLATENVDGKAIYREELLRLLDIAASDRLQEFAQSTPSLGTYSLLQSLTGVKPDASLRLQ